MYKVYRKYKKNGFQNTLKMAKMCSLRGTVQRQMTPGELWSGFVSSEGALYVILPYDYQASF